VNVRPLPEEDGKGRDGEIVFLRILDPRADGRVDFYPITLTLRKDGEGEPEVEVKEVRHHVHQGWRRDALVPALGAAGFEQIRAVGGMAETPYVPRESADLVLLARKAAG
jgi:hypothetical protein